jgi:hypothetical protein
MEKVILSLTGYQIAFIVLWLSIALYTDWRMYVANKKFFDKMKEAPYVWEDTFHEKIIKNFLTLLSPFYLVIQIVYHGIMVLSPKRSIFNGELF